jgi:hypothetical protein
MLKEPVTDEQEVSEELRKEQIETGATWNARTASHSKPPVAPGRTCPGALAVSQHDPRWPLRPHRSGQGNQRARSTG